VWLGGDLWAKQIEIAESVRDHRRTAVKSAHSVGKSFISARIGVWWLHAWQPSVVLTTAPTGRQVTNILWREWRTAVAKTKLPLLGRCLVQRHEIAPDWYAIGFKAADTDPDAFQGFHSLKPLVIVDEAAGVPETVFDALDAVMSNQDARMLLIGNPTNPAGTFYNAFHKDRALYHTISVTAYDTPNFQPGARQRPYLVSPQAVQEEIDKHGPDSTWVRCRINAEFPEGSSQGLIPLAWVEAANERRIEHESGDIEAGLDISRGGDDETALCIRRGIQVLEQHAWSGPETRDLMATVGKVRNLLAPYPTLKAIKVDVIGIGAGVYDRMRELGYPAIAVNVGSASSDKSKWSNLRHELYWSMREIFHDGAIAGPLDELCMGQLADVRASYDSAHSMPVIEKKEDMKKRPGGHSPDRAEALLLAFTNQVPHGYGQVVYAGERSSIRVPAPAEDGWWSRLGNE
jgi:hypothetical protein